MKQIVILVALTVVFYACEQKQEDKAPALSPEKVAQLKIDSLNAIIKEANKNGVQVETKTIMFAIQAYEDYAYNFPKDTLGGLYLRKAAELYEIGLRDYPVAIKRYEKAYNDYSNFEERPMALFRAASLYQDLGDTTNAIAKFNLFIENHPDHEFADDAKQMISITRMGMEDFIRQSIQKNRVENQNQ